MIEFQNCNVTINGTGLVAESASIDTDPNLIPIYVIGKKGTANVSPNGFLKNTIKFNYYPLLESEPIYFLSSGIKNFVNSAGTMTGVIVTVGGITGYNCFIENYSLKAAPNELVRASVSFASYIPVSGSLSTGMTNVDTNSLAYGWATYVASGSNYLTVPTYAFEYNFNANWQPIFIIGNNLPIQVELLNGQEVINLERDVFYAATFSGTDPCSQFMVCSLDGNDIRINNLSLVCETEGYGAATPGLQSMNFTMTGATVTNTNLNAKLDDIIRVETSIIKYF